MQKGSARIRSDARSDRGAHLSGATPPAPLSVAAGTAILTLCDADTPLHLAGRADTADTRAWIAFHTGAPIVEPTRAVFAVGTWQALLPLDPYPLGRSDYPDRSATLIVEMDALNDSGPTLTGPGIETQASLSLPERAAFQANHARFPLGLDFLFTCGDRVAALPRSTEVR